MIEYTAGIAEINAKALAVWNAASVEILGVVADIRFKGVEKSDLPNPGEFWGRISTTTVLQGRATLGANDQGSRRYETEGWVCIEIYGPKSISDSFDKARKLGAAIRRRFVGSQTAGVVRFENCRVDDNAGTEAQWNHVNFWTDWDFDELLPNGV